MKFIEMFGASHVNTNNAIETTAAIIWFSVRLDINIPSEMYAIDNSKNPNIATATADISGVLK